MNDGGFNVVKHVHLAAERSSDTRHTAPPPSVLLLLEDELCLQEQPDFICSRNYPQANERSPDETYADPKAYVEQAIAAVVYPPSNAPRAAGATSRTTGHDYLLPKNDTESRSQVFSHFLDHEMAITLMKESAVDNNLIVVSKDKFGACVLIGFGLLVAVLTVGFVGVAAIIYGTAKSPSTDAWSMEEAAMAASTIEPTTIAN